MLSACKQIKQVKEEGNSHLFLFNNVQLGWSCLCQLQIQLFSVMNRSSGIHHTWLEVCRCWVSQTSTAPSIAKEKSCTSLHNRFPRQVGRSSPWVSLLPVLVWEAIKGEVSGATAWLQTSGPSLQRVGTGLILLANLVKSLLTCLFP